MRSTHSALGLARPGNLAVAAGFLLLVLLNLLPSRWGVLALRTVWHLQLVRAVETDSAEAIRSLRGLVGDVRAWRVELEPLFQAAPLLAPAPEFGGDLSQAPQFARVVDRTLDAVEPVLVVYEALNQERARGLSPGAALVALAREHAGELKGARGALEAARTERAKIDERDLSTEAHTFLRDLDEVLTDGDAALALMEQAPALLGADAPRRYVVLAQNNDELRPTGGFISAVGVLRVAQGEWSVEWFGDSFAADDLTLIHPAPPAPLAKYMWASQWLVRDANWYAHFPSSASAVQAMLARDRGIKTDGVIAVDLRLLPRLVGAVGGVELGGVPLTPDNVIAQVKANWRPLPPGDMSAAWFASERKSFLGELLRALLARLKGGQIQLPALGEALWRGSREKSLQLYFEDEGAEQAVLAAGWGGAVEPGTGELGTGDILMVVDSNVGFNKVNALVSRAVRYTVRLRAGGAAEATVELNYHNPSRAAEGGCDLLKQHKDNTYASMEQSCYWNYLRVLAPRGSALQAAEGIADAGMADDIGVISAFGGYLVVPRASTRAVRLTYALPHGVWNDTAYHLRLDAQAGTGPMPVTVQVVLPPGYSLRGASDSYTWVDKQTVQIQTRLSHDTTLVLYFNSPFQGLAR